MTISDEDDYRFQGLLLAFPHFRNPTLLREIQDTDKRLKHGPESLALFELIACNLESRSDLELGLRTLDQILALSADPISLARNWLDQPDRFLKIWLMSGISPFLSQIMIRRHSELFGESSTVIDTDFSREALVGHALSLTECFTSENEVAERLRQFRQLWTARIVAAEMIEKAGFDETTRRISHLADACLEAALAWALNRNQRRYGHPLTPTGDKCDLVAMAFGKLGGVELNYSSDVDLIFIYSQEARTPGPRPLEAAAFFSNVITDFLKIMAGGSSGAFVLRVDLRLRPDGSQGPLLMSYHQTLAYYDTAGRTWERQALIKIRPCAGDFNLGEQFQQSIEPFVYRRHLTSNEIAEIQAMKRRIEHRSTQSDTGGWDVKTGPGGIRDIEFVVQFLQLLNGCILKSVRHCRTLQSLQLLEQAGCLTTEEFQSMQRNYIFLRKIEHWLQLAGDRQTHRIPNLTEQRRRLAALMGYETRNAWESADGPWDRFLRDYRNAIEENRQITNRILHDSFQTPESEGFDPVTDLILDPGMPDETRAETIRSFGITDTATAYEHLARMAREESSNYPTPRCRHFFSALAPKIMKLVAIVSTSPDQLLRQLNSISQYLPGKAKYWEILNMNPVALTAFFDLATQLKLPREILMKRPHLFDTWLNATLQPRPFTEKTLQSSLKRILKTTIDLTGDLREFRDTCLVQVAANHPMPLSPDSVNSLTNELSLVASCIIRQVSRRLWAEGLARWEQTTSNQSSPGKWAILAMGKLGSGELLFHSDLDLVFLHEIDTQIKDQRLQLSAEAFFQDLATRLIRTLSSAGSNLVYKVDTRLRPYGSSGPLSASIDQLKNYYQSEDARFWERAALIRSRPVFTQGIDESEIQLQIQQFAISLNCKPNYIANESLKLRARTLADSEDSALDLKRGPGGMHEAELLVQTLQLINLHLMTERPEANFNRAVIQLQNLRILKKDEAELLASAYCRFRQVETALRLLRNRTTHPLLVQADEYPEIEKMTGIEIKPDTPSLKSLIEKSREDVHRLFHLKLDRPDTTREM